MRISDIISLGSLILAFVVFIASQKRATKKDNSEETAVMVSLKADMKYMSKQINNIENKLNTIEEKVDDTNYRIAKNEERTNSALKQVDILRGRIEVLEHEKTNK